jgi:holin-like protein
MSAKPTLINFIYSCFAISLSLGLGYALNYLLAGLPPSLYGMIIFALLLHFNLVNSDKIKDSIKLIISNMGICFVPAGVGAMNHLPLLKAQGLEIFLMILVTTMLLMAVVGHLAQALLVNNTKNNRKPTAKPKVS